MGVAGVGGGILEETMRRLQRLQQEEDHLDVSLLDYKSRRARASHLDPHALFGRAVESTCTITA